MSGIVGLINLDGQPVEEKLLRRLSAPLAHRGPDGEGFWLDGPVGIGSQLFRVTPESAAETQPLAHPSGFVTVFDGRLDNREELLANLQQCQGLSSASPDPALVLAAYDAWGERFPEHLNGDFALALYDPRQRQLLLARDAIGHRPLYYCSQGNLFIFASEIKAILAHPQVTPRPDEHILSHYLLGGLDQSHQDLTYFEGIRSLPPSHQAILTSQGLVCRQYWDFDLSRQIRYQSFEEYAAAFRHLFEQAVRRRLRSANPVSISVSGGLDSSAVFCMAQDIRKSAPDDYPPLTGVTGIYLDGSPADEKEFIRELEQRNGIPIHQVPMGPLTYLTDRAKEIWYTETPDIDHQKSNTDKIWSHIIHNGSRVLMGGGWGDQMVAGLGYTADLVDRGHWGEALRHIRQFSRWFKYANPWPFLYLFFLYQIKYHAPEAWITRLRQWRGKLSWDCHDQPWFTQSFRKWAYEPTPGTRGKKPFSSNHARFLYDTVRNQYYLKTLEKGNKLGASFGLELATPFLDRDLVAFLMAIPGDMVCRQGIPKAILREAMQGVLPEAIRERRGKADFTELVSDEMKREFHHIVQFLLSGGSAVRWGFVNEAVMQAHLSSMRDLLGRRRMVTWNLGALLALEIWLEVFFK